MLRPTRTIAQPLAAVVSVVGGVLTSGADVAVRGITNRSGEVVAGDLYVGVPGSRAHGAQFAADAVAAGAVAVLTDVAGAELLPIGLVPLIVVPDVKAVIGSAASMIYGEPSTRLQMLGITATSGKTTTAYLVEAGLRAAGQVTGLMGTVETRIDDEVVTQSPGSSLTTPEAPDLHALLAVMLERGVSSVIMEVSSHALFLGRVSGIHFDVAAFGNLSQDHLDFHTDMDDYFNAKALLFDGRSDVHVVNVDDPYGVQLAARVPSETLISISPSGQRDADWRATQIEPLALGGSRFVAASRTGSTPIAIGLPGAFNVDNALMALAMLAAAGVPVEVAGPALAAVQVPGRMERVDLGQDFLAVVDYSHKPAAVSAVLAALRPVTPQRIICVLGCGGDRDRAKRPLMGAAAARDADIVIVTDDNPRTEDPATIRSAMLAGTQDIPSDARAEVREIGDRGEAIRAAVAVAGPGDTVLVAGKGHEVGQYVAGRVLPFDDRAELRAAIADRA